MLHRSLACALLSLFVTATALAHGTNDPPHQSFSLGDLKVESGESIKDFSMSYVTHTATCSIVAAGPAYDLAEAFFPEMRCKQL